MQEQKGQVIESSRARRETCPEGKLSKGQVSTELLIILGFVVLLMIPLLLLAYSKSSQLMDEMSIAQADIAASRLVHTVEAVGNTGNNASIITEISVPPGVQSFSVVGNREIVFTVRKGSALTEIVKLSRFNISMSDEDQKKLAKGGTYNVEVAAPEGIAPEPIVNITIS